MWASHVRKLTNTSELKHFRMKKWWHLSKLMFKNCSTAPESSVGVIAAQDALNAGIQILLPLTDMKHRIFFFFSINKWPHLIFLSFSFNWILYIHCWDYLCKSDNTFDHIHVNGYANFQAAMYLITGYASQLSADTNFTIKINRLTVVYVCSTKLENKSFS